MIIQNDAGEDIEVFSAEEVAQQVAQEAELKAKEVEEKYQAELKAKDEHYAEKLDQFVKAKKGIETKDDALEAKLAEIKKIAEEANLKVTLAEADKVETIKNFYLNQTVGGNEELSTKMKQAYDMLNMPATNEAEIALRVQMAANMIGVSSISAPNMTFSGGMAPTFKPADEKQSEAEYEIYKKEFGINYK